ICPVGALTDRDFRFRVRVWYLDTTKSICPGCARGCNVEVHVNRKRPHHAEGRRVARLKPRFNDAVNAWWICDVGRYGFDAVDDPSRIRFARRGDAEVELDEALNALLDALRRHTPAEIAILASPDLANEDLFALRRLTETLGIRQVAFGVPPAAPTPAADDFLLRADRHPNTRGAETILPAGDAAAILAAAPPRPAPGPSCGSASWPRPCPRSPDSRTSPSATAARCSPARRPPPRPSRRDAARLPPHERRGGSASRSRRRDEPVILDFGIVFGRVAFVMMFILNLGGLLAWVERKQSAIMQDRIGANRASIRIPFTRIQLRALGLFHPLADAIKMLTKEDFLPARADRLLFQLAPF